MHRVPCLFAILLSTGIKSTLLPIASCKIVYSQILQLAFLGNYQCTRSPNRKIQKLQKQSSVTLLESENMDALQNTLKSDVC